MSRQNEFFAFSAHPTYGAKRLMTFIILVSGANLSAKIKSCSLITSTTFLSSFNLQPHIFYLFSLCTTFMLYPFPVSFALSTFHSPPHTYTQYSLSFSYHRRKRIPDNSLLLPAIDPIFHVATSNFPNVPPLGFEVTTKFGYYMTSVSYHINCLAYIRHCIIPT